MPSQLSESDGEIAFLVRFGFQMGCAREVSYRPTYMDDLSCLLNYCNTGCINHLM